MHISTLPQFSDRVQKFYYRRLAATIAALVAVTIGLAGLTLVIRGGLLPDSSPLPQTPRVRQGAPTQLEVQDILGASSPQPASWYDQIKQKLDTTKLPWVFLTTEQAILAGPVGGEAVFKLPLQAKQIVLYAGGEYSYHSGQELFIGKQSIYRVNNNEELVSYTFDIANKETYLLIKQAGKQVIRIITSRGQEFTAAKGLDFDLRSLIRYGGQRLYGEDDSYSCWELDLTLGKQNNVGCALAYGLNQIETNFRLSSVAMLTGQISRGTDLIYSLASGELAKDPFELANRIYFRKFSQTASGDGYIANELGIFALQENTETAVMLLATGEKIKQIKTSGSVLYIVKIKGGVEELVELDLVASSTIGASTNCPLNELCRYQLF